MKVLIADDDPVSLLCLKHILEDGGYEVITVADGRSAYDILKRVDAPMLAIIDWMMPRMDGIDVCRLLRETVRNRYIYLIILSSRQETHFAVEAMDAGADDFIRKPYSVEELQARLRTGRRISELEQEWRIKATHDSLTGLYNHGAIIDILQKAMARHEWHGHPISIIFADLDHFKQTNDNYGHLAGDEVLREVARRATRLLRPYDSFGRYGGEELLIVLPECNAGGALAIAERLRSAIADQPVATSFGAIPTSLSLGVAVADKGTSFQFNDLILLADNALYQAKDNGRNCVKFAKAA
ncbi:MAG: diguanylate cyclase [Nitrosospira sp.]